MIELSPGKGIYAYESHITKSYSKQTETATARFLLSCYYKGEELNKIGKKFDGQEWEAVPEWRHPGKHTE